MEMVLDHLNIVALPAGMMGVKGKGSERNRRSLFVSYLWHALMHPDPADVVASSAQQPPQKAALWQRLHASSEMSPQKAFYRTLKK